MHSTGPPAEVSEMEMAKNKLKTHKGLSKRVKVTARGKVLARHPGANRTRVRKALSN